MTIAEKILSAKSGKTSVTPGEIVEAYPRSRHEPHGHVAIGQRDAANRRHKAV